MASGSTSSVPSLPSYRQIALTYLDHSNLLKPITKTSAPTAAPIASDAKYESSRASSVSFFPLTSHDITLLQSRYDDLFTISPLTSTGVRNAELFDSVPALGNLEESIQHANSRRAREGKNVMTKEEESWVKRERRWRVRLGKMREMVRKWEGLVVVCGGQQVTIAKCFKTSTSSPSTTTKPSKAPQAAQREPTPTRPLKRPRTDHPPEHRSHRSGTASTTSASASASNISSTSSRSKPSTPHTSPRSRTPLVIPPDAGRTSAFIGLDRSTSGSPAKRRSANGHASRPRSEFDVEQGVGVNRTSRMSLRERTRSSVLNAGGGAVDSEEVELIEEEDEDEDDEEEYVQPNEAFSTQGTRLSKTAQRFSHGYPFPDGRKLDPEMQEGIDRSLFIPGDGTEDGIVDIDMEVDANVDVDITPKQMRGEGIIMDSPSTNAEVPSTPLIPPTTIDLDPPAGQPTRLSHLTSTSRPADLPLLPPRNTQLPSPAFQILQSITLPTDDLFTIAITYDPLTFRPVIAVGGAGRLIWVVDVEEVEPDGAGADATELGQEGVRDITCRIRRVLRGHGDQILSVKFHPTKPHILASASADKTARLWNISGSGADLVFTKDPLPRYPPVSVPAGHNGHVNGSGHAVNGTDRDLASVARSEDAVSSRPAGLAQPPQKIKENEHLASWDYARGQADEGSQCVAIFAGEGEGGHRASCVDVAFHPTRACLATCGTDYQVRIWPMPVDLPKPSQTHHPLTLRDGYKPQVIYLPLFATGRLHGDVVDCIEWISDDVLVSKTTSVLIVWQWLGFGRYFKAGKPDLGGLRPMLHDYKESHSFRMIAKYAFDTTLWFMRIGVHRAFPGPSEVGNNNILALGRTGFEPSIALVDPGSYTRPTVVPPMPAFGIREDAVGVSQEEAAEWAGFATFDDGETVDLTMDNDEDDEGADDRPQEDPYGTVPDLSTAEIRTRDVKAALRLIRPKKDFDVGETNIWQVAMSPNGAEWMVAVGDKGLIIVYHRTTNHGQ